MRRPLRFLLPILVMLPFAACALPDFMTFPPQVRGNRVDEDQIKQMVPGTSTRADAMAALGSPTAKATFDDNTWIYIGEITKPVIGGTQEILDQQVVLLNFNQSGVLQSIEHKGASDAMPVEMVSRATPSPGSEASFLQQLLGNVGRFGTGAASAPSNNRSGTGSTTGGGL